jgi:hypothetical protein
MLLVVFVTLVVSSVRVVSVVLVWVSFPLSFLYCNRFFDCSFEFFVVPGVFLAEISELPFV